MRMPKPKKILLGVAALGTAAAVGAGIWFSTQGGSEPVPVFPFRQVGMNEYWGDNQESYGPVSTDRIQTVYVSDTQTVTEILVSMGDSVKEGDLLMTFDTTLTDIALERKRLDVEKLKLQMQQAEEKLQEIKAMKPMVIPDYSGMEDAPAAPETGKLLNGPYALSTNEDYDGSNQDFPLICWLNTAAFVDDDILEAIRMKAEDLQNKNAQKEWAANPPAEPDPPGEGSGGEGDSGTEGEPAPAPPEPPAPPAHITVTDFYVIIKVTQGNTELGSRITWQGLRVNQDGGNFRFKLFDAFGIMDHMLSEEDEDFADTSFPEIDYGSGYTAAQIAEMRREQEQKIKDLRFDIKMAETNYQIMQTEVSDGSVYAEIDGEVVSVISEEEAKLQRQPIIKISGGGGFFIEGTISELEKDNLTLGQEVTINDWNTGMTYPGKVTSLGDFPSNENGWNGMGNPNASYYPFTAFVDETADLQAGSYASIQFSTGGSEHGIYLENPFVLSEQGKYYVFVRGSNGRLEKRTVTVGKSLFGSYKEILSGLTEEDFIAFPYGKTVKEGAQTEESDLSVLYE